VAAAGGLTEVRSAPSLKLILALIIALNFCLGLLLGFHWFQAH
jgi:hypothetical protein